MGARPRTLATGAVVGAPRNLRRKRLAVASRLLEIDAADLTWSQGRSPTSMPPSIASPKRSTWHPPWRSRTPRPSGVVQGIGALLLEQSARSGLPRP
jgi:hypothetical protein